MVNRLMVLLDRIMDILKEGQRPSDPASKWVFDSRERVAAAAALILRRAIRLRYPENVERSRVGVHSHLFFEVAKSVISLSRRFSYRELRLQRP